MAKHHPLYEAAGMAADEMRRMLDFVSASEFGHFPGPAPSARARRLMDSPEAQRLMAEGFTKAYAERVAKMMEEES